MPESTHMLMLVMSDRAIPRSLRMIEGFGIQTFRLINAKGRSSSSYTGIRSSGCNRRSGTRGSSCNDYDRRDLWEAMISATS
jgi:catalase